MKMLLSFSTLGLLALWPASADGPTACGNRRLPDETGKSHRSPPAGKCKRPHRPRPRSKALRGNGRSVLCREPSRRRRDRRNGYGRQRACGRPYDPGCKLGFYCPPGGQSEGAIRSVRELRTGFAPGIRTRSDRGASFGPGERYEGAGRAPEGQSGQVQLRKSRATGHRRTSHASGCSRSPTVLMWCTCRSRAAGKLSSRRIAGHTAILHITLPLIAQHLKDGTLRALAIASSKRSPLFPDLPTLAEAGIPKHEVASGWAYWRRLKRGRTGSKCFIRRSQEPNP